MYRVYLHTQQEQHHICYIQKAQGAEKWNYIEK